MELMKQSQIAGLWQTERLSVADSRTEEIDALQGVYDACAYIGEWCGESDDSTDAIKQTLAGEHLPPNGSKEFCRLQSVRTKKNDLVGYLELYHGFPDATTFWIATLAIDVPFQHQKYGQEVIYGLVEQIKALNCYREIGIAVGAKNWPALRFWTQCGFDRIGKFEGDKICSDKTFANFWLYKQLL